MQPKENEKYLLTNGGGESLMYKAIIREKIPLTFIKYTKQGLAYLKTDCGTFVTVKRKSLIPLL